MKENAASNFSRLISFAGQKLFFFSFLFLNGTEIQTVADVVNELILLS